MEQQRVYVGIDYHASFCQVCVLDAGGGVVANGRCRSDVAAIIERASACGRVERVAIESCSGAAELGHELVAAAGWRVSLAHPGYVRRMKHNPDKSDMADARILADLCRAGYLPEVWLAPTFIRELRSLVRYRFQNVQERSRIKTRILGVLRDQRVIEPAELSRWTKAWLRWLQEAADLREQTRWIVDRLLVQIDRLTEEIRASECRLEKVTAEDDVVARLMTQPGVGPVTAWTIRAEVGIFDRFRTGKQLSRYCGLSPRNASSGQRMADAGLIRAGNPLLKTVLIQAAHRLARYQTRWRRFAQHLRARGRHGSVVAAAVANRWVRWLFHQMKQEQAMT